MSMKTLRHFVLLLAGLLAVSCSTEKETWLKIDVLLDPNLATPPDQVQIAVQAPSASLATQQVAWSKATGAVLKVALPLSISNTETVKVTAVGLNQGSVTSSASQDGVAVQKDKENGPVTLVLAPASTTPDADADARVPDGGASEAGQPQPDALAPDAGADAPVPDAGVDAPVPDAASVDTQPLDAAADAAELDGSPVDAASDAPQAPNWSAPINVQNASPDYTCVPEVAVAPLSGDAVVIWVENGIGVYVANYKAATDKWSAPIALQTKGDPRSATVAVDSRGTFTAVWGQSHLEGDPTPLGIYATTSADGINWSAPKLMAAGVQTYAYYPELHIAMNRAGQARVVWEEYENPAMYSRSKHDLYTMFLDATSPAKLLDTCNDDCVPRVAIDGNGNGLVVWGTGDKTTKNNASVWAARFSKEQVQANELVETYDVAAADTAEVAINAAGQGLVVWQQRTASSNLDIYARRYSTALGWTGEAESVAHVSWAGEMSLAMGSTGTANLGWSRPTAMLYQATFSSQPLSGAWTTANRETDDKAPDLTITDVEPQVAVGATGDVLMAWRKKVSDTAFAPHFAWQIDGTWTEAEVGKIADLFAEHIRVGVADNGQAVAAWTYYHCSPISDRADKICPTAKQFSALDAATKAAWGNVFVSVYR